MNQIKTDFSIIIPVYNEEKRIPLNMEKIFSFFNSLNKSIEIIFVNDGSKDGTSEVLKKLRNKFNFKIVDYDKNMGKGYAIRQGFLASSGKHVVFFDIDLATPLNEFNKLLKYTLTGGIVIGSRRVTGAEIRRGEPIIRVMLGKGFSGLSKLFVPGINDFTCGFKCFSKEAASQIFPIARIDRWAFDTELLYLAKIKGIPITQIPVSWAHDENSKVRVLRDVATSARDLCFIIINRLLGRYK